MNLLFIGKTTWGFIIALISLGVAGLIYFLRYKLKNPPLVPIGTNQSVPIPGRFPFSYARPDGGEILSVYPIAEDLLPTVAGYIQRGLADMIAATSYHNPGWTKMPTTGDYPVWFIEPMATNQDGTPALLVYGVQSAGTTLNVGYTDGIDRGTPVIVLPAQAAWNFLDYLQTSTHNEGEHAREWVCDQAIFWKFTGAYDVHPHWSAPPAV